ncbi:hypothetical protein GCM10010912_54690 [Paenibacillus albidus]|uniref:Crp/Fnr family transcriptional regulator n=1 Tax=Paenibacillus albidus TaxID=2041023 RepID=A0A917CXZ8_9BACL|nr:Crp/Fnr family transcriptional regulator [Paenibacillus albidus]GGG03011.1 hypothetical protein GCM10010912_54690 [Paenibacillus albidus]
MQLADLIRSIPKLEHMLMQLPAEVCGRFVLRKFPAHTVIVRKDQTLTSVYIICTGRMRIVNEFDNGRLYAFTDTNLYTMIGETEILAGVQEYGCTVESVTECMTVQMSREDFVLCFETSHVFAKEISKDIAYKLHQSSSKMGENLFYPVRYNLVCFLIAVAQKELAAQTAAVIPLKRQDMADRLGISLRSVNRVIQKLKEDGHVSIVKGKIHIEQQQYIKLTQMVNDLK